MPGTVHNSDAYSSTTTGSGYTNLVPSTAVGSSHSAVNSLTDGHGFPLLFTEPLYQQSLPQHFNADANVMNAHMSQLHSLAVDHHNAMVALQSQHQQLQQQQQHHGPYLNSPWTDELRALHRQSPFVDGFGE